MPPGQRNRKEIAEDNIYRAIRNAVEMMHGDFGLASVSLSLRGKNDEYHVKLRTYVQACNNRK